MSAETSLIVGGLMLAFGLACLACARGCTLKELSFLGVKVELPRPIVVAARRGMVVPTVLLLALGLIGTAWGTVQKIWPEPFPPDFNRLISAQLRLENVDDRMWVRVNGVLVAQAWFGYPTEWIDFTHLLRRGINRVEVVMENGAGGGCGGSLLVRANGQPVEAWSRSFFVEGDQPAWRECYHHHLNIRLP